MNLNLPTLAYKMMTGQWRLDRQYVKESRALLYAGAEPGNKRPTPNQLTSPESPKSARQRIIMIRAARELEEDFSFADAILSEYETYTVGPCIYSPGTGNEEADAVIREFLDLQFDTCDYSGRFNLNMLARLAIRSNKRDGELGWVIRESSDRIMIEAIAADCIGDPMNTWNGDPKNYNGIIINEKTMRPEKYEIFKEDPKKSNYVKSGEVKANDFLHYFNPFRTNQLHGVTLFKNTIEHQTDIKQITDFTKLNIKWRSAQLPYVTNETGKVKKGASGYTGSGIVPGDPTVVTQDVGGVSVNYMKTGEAIMEYPNDFPNAQFGPLMDHLKRDCAMGGKIPLEFFYQSENGGVIHRFFADKAQRTFDFEKEWLKRSLLSKTKNRMIEKGIETGMLDLGRFGNLKDDPSRFKGTWQMGADISVDYGNEVTADIKLMDAGLMASDDYIESMNLDPKKIRVKIRQKATRDIEDAQTIAKERGITWQEAMPFINKKFPNPTMPAASGAPGEVDMPTGANEETSNRVPSAPFNRSS